MRGGRPRFRPLISEEAFEDLDAPIKRLAAPDVPIPFSPRSSRRSSAQLDDMKEALGELLSYWRPSSMPQMGISVSEGTILEWRKAVGDTVAASRPIADVTTDKVDVEIPCPASGVLAKIRRGPATPRSAR